MFSFVMVLSTQPAQPSPACKIVPICSGQISGPKVESIDRSEDEVAALLSMTPQSRTKSSANDLTLHFAWDGYLVQIM